MICFFKNRSIFAGFALNALILMAAQSVFGLSYPISPNLSLTPGTLCNQPDSYRYQERIPYCNRDVSTDLKQDVIQEYNRKLGYQILPKDRSAYKIDHFIPLCAGGGNDMDNLWPQHAKVYSKTDPIEEMVCEKMKLGKLSQRDAVEFIKKAKLDLSQADLVFQKIKAL